MNSPSRAPKDSQTDNRLEGLKCWAASLTDKNLLIDSLRPASSDASFRRYFRINDHNQHTYIIMDAPPPEEDVRPFMQVAQLFAANGLNVPAILAQDAEQGWLLLSDLGQLTYLEHLTAQTASKLYDDAIQALIMLQLRSEAGRLPAYDKTQLLNEIALFPEWYLARHKSAPLTPLQQQQLQPVFEQIVSNNLAQPQVYVHRDYHSRNLMVSQQGAPGILDFQDAVYGPITYDLVSLLRDAYISWEEEQVLDWVVRYWQQAKAAGLPVQPDIDLFYRDFEWMGLQRHLKVLGIFARLFHRDGKAGYLKDLPLVLSYVRRTASRYAVFSPLERLFDELEKHTALT